MIQTSPVNAIEIEKLVMPGQVVRSHADVEGECSSCHLAFEKGNQNTLCIACHEDVGADIQQKTGFHGRSPDVADSQCRSCHTDHAGRDADIVNLDEQTFDHELTDFHLSGKHAEIECTDCHAAKDKHRDAPTDCIGCHREDDVHAGNLGDACADCHSAAGWKDIQFDHDSTGYPLLGKHANVQCGDCHVDSTFQATPTTCFGCHEKDDAHEGRSGTNCGNCHNPRNWQDTSFNHERDTAFPLDGRHAELTCSDCHSDDPFADKLQTTCISCHLEDDKHEDHFGDKCDTCHVTSAWAEIAFDHDRDTEYALRGAHASITCNDCHVKPIYDVALESTCVACHREDDAHKGEQGARCEDCHNETSWTEDVRFDHGLTRFPLLGAHADAECTDCHETHEFRQVQTECNDCHADDNPHQERYSLECGLCHNPVAWDQWIFDHNTQTDFVLDGAHVDVHCDDCHRQSLSAMTKLGDECGDCHKLDDVHDGEFGADCGRCHSSTSFRDVRSVR